MSDMIGHNNPPEPTPYERAVAEADKWYTEAGHWLDGAVADSQEYADAIGKLLGHIREATKAIDAARGEEKRPHDEAAKAVQERYKPLLDKLDMAAKGCKKALTPWLEKLEAQKRAEAEAKRAEAERLRLAAEEAVRKANAANLAEAEERERAIEALKRAEAEAARAEKAKAQAKGTGRAVGLRTIKRAVLKDRREAARFFWTLKPEEFDAFLSNLAAEYMRHGHSEIPGFEIVEERSVA